MKNNELVLLDLFSGMGGFHLGLEDAGLKFKKVYYSEVDKHAIANYKYNFPNAEHIGSVEHILNSGIERPNIITFGSPCQDFSLAGKRKGLDGDRSSLIEYALSAVSHFRPDIFIWENVKGTFSSNGGRDFIAILQAIADIGLYECEWQLVNTSWLLPQNRERIYLVGHLTESFRDWKRIFPITEDDFNIIKERGRELLSSKLCGTIGTQFGRRQSDIYIKVNSATKKGFEEASKGDSINLQYPNSKTRRGRVGKGVAQTLDCNCNQGVIQLNPSTESGGKQPYQHNRIYDLIGLAPTLNTDSRPPLVIGSKQTNALGRGNNVIGLRVADYRQDEGLRYRKDNIVPCIPAQARTDFRNGAALMVRESSIRRLTEIECERLQGFPDDWTKWGIYDGEVKPISKTQRYKMCGNAVTAKMVELIGSRIIKNKLK